MEREELLKSEGYWIAKIQTDLYREITAFMERNNMSSTQLANYLGCSKSYVSQLLNGNFNHKISKLVELSLAIGKAPVIDYQDLQETCLRTPAYKARRIVQTPLKSNSSSSSEASITR